jgi:hypothetical protein
MSGWMAARATVIVPSCCDVLSEFWLIEPTAPPMFNINKARAKIEERNRVRAEAQLPLLSIPQELRKLYELQRQTEFEEFFRTSPRNGLHPVPKTPSLV